MSVVQTEHVLVVPTAEFKKIGYFQGICTEVDHYLGQLLTPELISYRPRDEMEENPSFKQLIPYVIFRHLDADGQCWLFQYTRGSGQGEKRLHAKRSIGIGGHISSDDAGFAQGANPYHEGMRRELSEEVAIKTKYSDRCVGLINDDETEVGKVHLGIVHIFDVEQQAVTPCEDEIHEAGFVRVEELFESREGMESWSRICMEGLFSPA
ncbi:MAG: NUDIX domain-containing protein [Pirellulaceae bacterium]|nr:NUDIX domain-containing protein [Pirellulaceae bacterium]